MKLSPGAAKFIGWIAASLVLYAFGLFAENAAYQEGQPWLTVQITAFLLCSLITGITLLVFHAAKAAFQ